MIKPNDVVKLVRMGTKAHFPLILTVAAGVGTLTTAYLAAKASFQAAEIIQNDEELKPPYANSKDQLKGRSKLVWKLYIPAGISAGCTIACLAGSHHVATKKTLAAQAAVALSQRAYAEYRDKVIKEFGERKDETIRADIASERVRKTLPGSSVIVGAGNVLCHEAVNDRYFMSDMESLLTAVNKLNHRVIGQGFQTLNDFYNIVGIPETPLGDEAGWTDSRLMELEVSFVGTDDNRPCLSFMYNYIKPFGKASLMDDAFQDGRLM